MDWRNWLNAFNFSGSLLLGGMAVLVYSRSLYIWRQNRPLKTDKIKKYLSQEGQQPSFEELKQSAQKGETVYIELPGLLLKEKQPQLSLFKRDYHAQNIKFSPFVNDFFRRQTGNEMLLSGGQWNKVGVDVAMEIKESSFHKNCIEVWKRPVTVSDDHVVNHAFDYSYRVMLGLGLGVIGKVSYDVEQGRLVLLPDFVVKLSNFADTVGKTQQMLRYGRRQAANGFLLVGFCTAMVFTVVLLPTCKKVFKWIKSVISKRRHEPGAAQAFDRIEKVGAPESQKLRCPCGRISNAVFECHHLASCLDCFQARRVTQCRICHRVSTRVMQVFL